MFVAVVVYTSSILNKTKRKYNMTKQNGKTNENFLNIIATSSIDKPELVVPNSFTALHVASICAELYSGTAPTWQMSEFTTCFGGDFGAYDVDDQMDMAQHYFDTAFAIGESVKENLAYSVQEAYDAAIDICADTVIRENVMSDVFSAIKKYSGKYDDFIQEDYLILNEEAGLGCAKRIAKLEAELAELKAS